MTAAAAAAAADPVGNQCAIKKAMATTAASGAAERDSRIELSKEEREELATRQQST